MSDPTTTRLDEVALFRYGLIADLKDLPPGTKGLGKLLAQKASAHYCIPGSTRTRVDAETIRHWLRYYRRGGFDALKPKPRKDAGSSHALPQELVDRLCQLKEEKPELSVQLLIRELREAGHIAAGLAGRAEHRASAALARRSDAQEVRRRGQRPPPLHLRARQRPVDERRHARARGARRRQDQAQGLPHRLHR